MEIVRAERFVLTRFCSLALALNFKILTVLLLVRFLKMLNGRKCKINLRLNGNTDTDSYVLYLCFLL